MKGAFGTLVIPQTVTLLAPVPTFKKGLALPAVSIQDSHRTYQYTPVGANTATCLRKVGESDRDHVVLPAVRVRVGRNPGVIPKCGRGFPLTRYITRCPVNARRPCSQR